MIAEEFTFANVRRVAQALCVLIRETKPAIKPVVVGHDLRFLSERFAQAFAEILAANDVPVWFIVEPVPTPMLMLAVEQERLDFGVMLTASHNPPEYHGIKLIVEKGKDAPVEVTQKLEAIIARTPSPVSSTPFDEWVAMGKIRYYSNKNQYIDSLLAQVDLDQIQRRNLRILFNPMHGVAKDIMAICLGSLRCSVDIMNAHRDALFGVKPPTPDRAWLQDMEYRMRSGRYDLGVATDGDSDRIGLYDEKGRYVDPNAILKLLYYYFKEYRRESGGIVRNVATTHILDRIAAAYGESVHEVPVGFKYISWTMEEHDLLMGGESSGGLKIRGHVNGKDGILAALITVEMLAKTNKTLSDLLIEIDERFGTLFYHSLDLRYRPDRESHLRALLQSGKILPNIEKPIEKISTLDGVKLYFADGTWLLLRFSGTEPLLRVAMEMRDEDEADQIVAALFDDPQLGLASVTEVESRKERVPKVSPAL